MKIVTACCIAVASLLAIPALACDNPPLVAVPDGATATMEELVAVQAEVQAYMAAMEEYIGCIDAELEAGGGEDAPDLFEGLMVRRHNQGVEEMELIAEAFNEQVRAYREANPEPEGGEDEEE